MGQPVAHAAEQPKENWEPVRSQYVWVEGKLTENQPETFPKKLRVYVHGVGTGIAENVRPVTETEAEQPKLTEEQVRSFFLQHNIVVWERPASWRCHCGRWALDSKLNDEGIMRKSWAEHCVEEFALLTSPVAPPPQVTVSQGGLPNASPPSWAKPEWAEWTYDPATGQFQPPLAPGEQPPLEINYRDGTTEYYPPAPPAAQERANHHFIQGFLWAECSCGWCSVICAHQECNELFAEHLAAQPSPQTKEEK